MKSRNLDYIPRLDHLRLLAALLVVGFHFFHYYAGGWQALPSLFWMGLITEGHTGVSLFFVLSGFIFMTIAQAGGSIRYGQFLRNRILRIAPLFLVVFMVAISIGRDRFEATDILYLLFTNLGNAPTSWHFATGPAWSISVEFTFYLVFPFLALFVRDHGPSYLVKLVLLMLVVKLAAYFATANSTHMLYSTLVGRFDQFLVGMLVAIIHHQRQGWLHRHGGKLLLVSVVAILVMVGAQARWASFFAADQKQPFWIIWGTIESALWGAVAVGYLNARFSWPTLVESVLRKGGEWSFSIYMWHALVIFTLHELFGRIGGGTATMFLIDGALVLACTLVLACLSYSVIERPFLQLRGRYRDSGAKARQEADA
ncbi:acyltransferase [Mesorhizobium sp. CAU 1741]|uniref:acyltransferase family protein n=1 Tax=Mesorhizobium sp. CAU 1741 TaxID=3140366 RepID=UPI00325C118E